MGKFCQYLTELSARDTIIAGYNSLTFLFRWFKRVKNMSIKIIEYCHTFYVDCSPFIISCVSSLLFSAVIIQFIRLVRCHFHNSIILTGNPVTWAMPSKNQLQHMQPVKAQMIKSWCKDAILENFEIL